ncbi:MAG: DNA primase [Acidobacteria bacterium]|nr:DNA primase [Acidobacteriota bacterium]
MDFAQQLKSSIDIVDVIGERVRLKRSGSGPRYMGLCPFHTEKTPSFSVHASLQIYKCFGCNASGDVFKFVMEIEQVTFFEAVKLLAERFGIPMPKRSEFADRESRLREAIHRMNEIALRHFRSLLAGPQGADTRRYLAERGVSPESTEEFGLGLAERGGSLLTQALLKEGFPAEQIEQSGLVMKRQDGSGYYDRFRGRLIFPIHNESGKVAGFAGRALAKDDEPKYLNSPETPVYKKSQLLYNLNRAKEPARKQGRFVLVEGYMDVIGLSAAGIREVVASCGTALTPGQVKLMKRFADQVTVNFDPDAGGVRGAERSLEVLLHENTRVRILELDRELDPDEYVKQFGPEMYLSLLERAPNYYFWLADQARRRFDSRTAEGRVRALQFLLPAIQRIPDKIERAAVADDVAAYLAVERGLVLDQFRKAALDRREQTVRYVPPPLRPVEMILVSTLLMFPPLRAEVFPQLEGVQGLEQFRSRGLVETMLSLFRVQPDFTYSELEGRLEENDRALLSAIVFADEIHQTGSIEAARSNVLSCLRTIQTGERDARISRLRQGIKEAQQRGDFQSALRLVEELDRLQRSSASAEPPP